MKLLQQSEKLKNVEKTARKPKRHSGDRGCLKKNYFIAAGLSEKKLFYF